MPSEPFVVSSDVHLAHDGPAEPARDLARLLGRYPGHEVVLAGDVFDLSVDPPERDPAESILTLLAPHPELLSALRSHLSGGGKLTLVPGNHDATLIDGGVTSALLARLELSSDARLEVCPWFVRRGRVHVEHGHLYDPDNAPTHPLALWSHETEPLGISLTRQFLAPNRALAFAHAHETTPLGGLLRTFRLFGPRAPLVVARYFITAAQLCAQAGRQLGIDTEREIGAGAVSAFAEAVGLDARLVHELAGAGPAPTHHDFAETFMRLYFDRVIATVVLASGAAVGLAAGSAVAAGAAAVSAAYLAASVATSGSRYTGLVEDRLREAARDIADLTDAALVVFGHTHNEDAAERYVNSGSFSYSRRTGRPYLFVDPAGSAERRVLTTG